MTPRPWITCPCCGYRTITEEYDICDICRWEHDLVQERDPDYMGGANSVSLRQAQWNFGAFGACERASVAHARKPGPDDVRDPNWKPLQQGDEGE